MNNLLKTLLVCVYIVSDGDNNYYCAADSARLLSTWQFLWEVRFVYERHKGRGLVPACAVTSLGLQIC